MGIDVATQAEAWRIYDLFYRNGMTFFADEPKALEERFRARSGREESSTKEWADAYLIAFAEAANLRLVTFDKAMAGKLRGTILLSTRLSTT